jgi:WD40 repeat protein
MRPSTVFSLLGVPFVILAQHNVVVGQDTLWTKDRVVFGALAFAPNEKLIAGATSDGRIELWDIQAKSNRTVLKSRRNEINQLAFSSDSRYLAAACVDSSLYVVDLKDSLAQLKLEGDGSELKTIVFDPKDSNTLYGGGLGGNLIRWNLATKKSIVLAKIGEPIDSIVITQTGGLLAIVARDEPDNLFERRLPGVYYRFDIEKKQAERIKLESKGQITAACGLTESYVAFGAFEGQLLVVDIQSNKIQKTMPGNDMITAMSSSKDGNVIGVSNLFGKVWVWDRKADRVVAEFSRPGQLAFNVAVSPSGKMIAGTFGNEELTEGAVILKQISPK